MKYTGLITVRLNSKRVPKKSILKLNEKDTTLVGRTVHLLNSVKNIDETIVYCTEDLKEYIPKNLNWKTIERPDYTNKDTSSFNTVIDSVIDKIETDYIVFVCCTSPFLKKETIEDMIEKIKNHDYDSSFAAVKYNNFAWFNKKCINYDPSKEIPRTQDLEPVLFETSSIYIFKKNDYIKNKRRIGDKPYIKIINKIEGIDIDEYEDLEVARNVYKEKNNICD